MSDLYDALDRAAEAILRAAMEEPTVKDGEVAVSISLTEKVRAFECIAKWADTRSKMKPPKPQESQFAHVRATFNGSGGAAPRRGRAAKAETDPPLDA